MLLCLSDWKQSTASWELKTNLQEGRSFILQMEIRN